MWQRYQVGVSETWDEKMLILSSATKACSLMLEQGGGGGDGHTLFCHHMCKALRRRRKEEGVREHAVSIHVGIVMIHVVPETENMSSEHAKITRNFLVSRRLLITSHQSRQERLIAKMVERDITLEWPHLL